MATQTQTKAPGGALGNYLVEVWRAAGMRMDRVEFRWASDEICRRGDEYWP